MTQATSCCRGVHGLLLIGICSRSVTSSRNSASAMTCIASKWACCFRSSVHATARGPHNPDRGRESGRARLCEWVAAASVDGLRLCGNSTVKLSPRMAFHCLAQSQRRYAAPKISRAGLEFDQPASSANPDSSKTVEGKRGTGYATSSSKLTRVQCSRDIDQRSSEKRDTRPRSKSLTRG